MICQTIAFNPMTELGPSNPIYLFMILSEYRILVYQKRWYPIRRSFMFSDEPVQELK